MSQLWQYLGWCPRPFRFLFPHRLYWYRPNTSSVGPEGVEVRLCPEVQRRHRPRPARIFPLRLGGRSRAASPVFARNLPMNEFDR